MTGEIPYRLAVLALLLANIVIRLRFHKLAGTRRSDLRTGREGRALCLYGTLLLPWLLAPVLYVVHPPLLAWAALPLPLWTRITGLVGCVLGLWLSIWIHHTLGLNFSPALRLRPDHTLVTSGPYRHVRHPMYTMGVLAWFCTGLLTANWFIGLGGVAFLLFCLRRIPDEEAMMIEAFGDEYRAYRTRTGRLLPRWR
jgi:protein-S-isoprenylcysteine O-methyltransferase Ste14